MSERQRTRLQPDVRREQILAAATRLFRSQGYHAVSVGSVAEAAGVTRGLLHHYFGTKRELFMEVVERAVRVPTSVQLVPPGVTGDLREVLAACVETWMRMIELSGGLWSGIADTGGIGGADADAILARARDDLVERMIVELPFPEDLDRDMLRSALRCYAAMARIATEEWLVRGSIDGAATEALLLESLLGLVDRVVPAMRGASDAADPSTTS